MLFEEFVVYLHRVLKKTQYYAQSLLELGPRLVNGQYQLTWSLRLAQVSP